MKQLKQPLTVFVLTLCTLTALSQDQKLLENLPSTKEEYVASEGSVLATIDWLENTPINQEEQKRKLQNGLLLAWLTNSPTVTITLNADMLDFSRKNPDLLMIFMGGWTRYILQNNYSKNEELGTLAGIRSAIKVYKTGLLKKDKAMQKLVDIEEKGELEAYVRNGMVKK